MAIIFRKIRDKDRKPYKQQKGQKEPRWHVAEITTTYMTESVPVTYCPPSTWVINNTDCVHHLGVMIQIKYNEKLASFQVAF